MLYRRTVLRLLKGLDAVQHQVPEASDLLNFSAQMQKRFENATSLAHRKQKGQVFTPRPVARFMAGLLTEIPARFRLLDPGAGVGTLTAAVCERICKLSSPRSCEF